MGRLSHHQGCSALAVHFHLSLRFCSIVLLLLLVPALSLAQTKRVVVVKIDGLPYDLLDSFVAERDARTGKSQLPWIDHVFYQRGTRLANFYVRGMSLSAPSWSLLDTGQHLQIKGNVEFDRYTLHSYDYLNFIPFYLSTAAGGRIDMPGTEVLDSLRLPLLSDAFPHEERYPSFQLYQRGMRFTTLQRGLEKRFMKNPLDLASEWTMGFEVRNTFFDQMEHELIQKLDDPRLRYLDLYVSGFDHAAHHNRDHQSHLFALRDIDSLIGRIWTAIQKSSLADETALIMVSDHGFNTDEKTYSQGYNLVKLLGSATGGGHHVITKRRLMLDYSIKGMNVLVPLITTTTRDSYYLKGQSTDYPTALLDFDGNERASIHLRDSDLNLLHILLQQLQRNDLPLPLRRTATDQFFNTLEKRRAGWRNTLDELSEELSVLRTRIEEQRKRWAAQPKKFSTQDMELGRDDEAKRVFAVLDRWVGQEKAYTEYVRTLTNLLSLRRENFSPARLRIDDLIAKGSMGERNSIYELQKYIVGLAPSGIVLKTDGSLDLEKSFVRKDYFPLLYGVSVRNNVQPGVANRPIDFIATRISSDLVAPLLNEQLAPDVVWVYAGPEKQCLILSREDDRGGLSFRYQPIRNLTQDESGRVKFDVVPWQPDLPLRIFEDPKLEVPENDRQAWLSKWHTDVEWLHALHRTRYSNGLIGLHEQVAQHPIEKLSQDEPGISVDERIARRFIKRQRALIETDLLLMANDHWNFDVRGFNPGGNHGSFLRVSTHSTLMISGGEKTQLSHGSVIEEPYDSLSFVPTVLALTGNLRDDRSPVPVLWDKGFRPFPGRIIKELFPDARPVRKLALTEANSR